MPRIDLTPFGFTSTESLAYDALLTLGPASGYAVAKEIGVARANAYQALNGLVSKNAAALIDDNPQRFRATRPDALLARITSAEAGKLATLERQVHDRGGSGGDAIVEIGDARGLIEVVTRWAGRTSGDVLLIAPQRVLDALQPVLRKRGSDGSPTGVWATENLAESAIGPALTIFWSEDAALIAEAGEATTGFWVSDRTLMAVARLAIQQITQPVD